MTEFKEGRCADCKFLMKCMTNFYNTPVGNMNLKRYCTGFEKVEMDEMEIVTFT